MIKVLAAEPRSKKKRSGDEAFEVRISGGSAANSHSTCTAVPPPNLPRLVHNTASISNASSPLLFFWIAAPPPKL